MEKAFPVVIMILTLSIKGANSDYTPLDYITGQTPIEFHEEKKEKEHKDDQGDDKDKHKKKLTSL
jgi:hypothetical protein